MLLTIYLCGFVVCFVLLLNLGIVDALLRATIWPFVFVVLFIQWVSNLTAIDDPDDDDPANAP